MKTPSALLAAISLTVTTFAAPAPAQQRPASRVTPQQFLQHYFAEVINRGNSGLNLWCSYSSDKQSTFFAPRAYRVQGSTIAPNGSGGSFRVQIDSSNRGGSPITANWLVIIERESNPAKARQLYGGWCISDIWQR